ncbi:hypothetical protein FACS189419_05270 [Planctomycetales bacterium]|nr:hypothetical protein FACS189419_05270 [Planctomycetales bacterium]
MQPVQPILQSPYTNRLPAGTQQPGLVSPIQMPSKPLSGDPVKMFGGGTAQQTPEQTQPPVLGGSLPGLIQDTPLFKKPDTIVDESDQPAEMVQLDKRRTNPYFESETIDQQIDREIQEEHIRAASIADPDRKRQALDNVIERKNARRNWLKRRAEAEEGADFFIHPKLKQNFLESGWCQLFDGYTSFGWNTQDTGHYAGGKFYFENEEIISDPYHPGLIYTKAQFNSIALRFEYCSEPDAEVFLLLKTPPNPDDLYTSCYTVVLNSAKASRSAGLLLGRQDKGIGFDNMSRQGDEKEWRSVVLQMDATHLQVWIDRQSPTNYVDTHPIFSGHIGFLVAKGEARFRNVFWQPAAPVTLFDPENNPKKTWKSLQPEIKLTYSPETGIYRLSGGSGVVESLETFDNFVLQFEYFSAITSAANSLFIRSLPGIPQSGYEISLQNFPTKRDREQNVGTDAGAFRRIQDARYVRALDQNWNFVTVLASGRHFQTWVNGVPVCEITDKRSVKADWSKSPFLEPGTFQLFCGQSAASLQLRNIKIEPFSRK